MNHVRRPLGIFRFNQTAKCSRGPSTVREVLASLNEKKNMGYTGVLKLLQIMTAKGLVRRDETNRAHVYEARQTKRQLATDMLHRVFEGSASQLMMFALAANRSSPEEIEELRHIPDAYNGDNDGNAE